jgi:hypothetical protein
MRLAALVTVLGCFGLGLQFQAVSSQVPPAAGAPGFLNTIAGVYRFHFKNGFVRPGDGTYESEDILEVVPLDERTAYVRASLEFFNGHSGGIYGVATLQGRTLLYDDGRAGPDRCVVRFVWEDKDVVTKADYELTPGCTSYHGARGSLDGARFPRASRRPIRYLSRLKASKEFREATEKYRASAGAAHPDGSAAPPDQ